MKNPYAGTKTEKNLWEAFAGESQARNKYTYFASVAKKAGYEQIAELFLKTAENEKEHAKLWFKALGELGAQKTCSMRLKARMQNGQICMTAWQEKQRKKALQNLLLSSEELLLSKNPMKRDIAHFLIMLRQSRYSRRAEL